MPTRQGKKYTARTACFFREKKKEKRERSTLSLLLQVRLRMGWKACQLGRAGRQAGRWTGTAHRMRIPPSVQRHLTCQLHERAPRSDVASLAHGLPSECGPLSVAFLDGGEEERERRRSGFPSVAEPGASPEQQQHGQAARRVSSSGGGGRVVPSPLFRRPRELLPSRGQHDVTASTQRTNTRTRAHRCPYLHLVVAFPPLPLPGEKRKGGGGKEGGDFPRNVSLALSLQIAGG